LESDISKFDKFASFNSAPEGKKHEFGCGFYVREHLK
jgi:hypothetical protein